MEIVYRSVNTEDVCQISALRKQLLEEVSGTIISQDRFLKIQEAINHNLENRHCFAMGAFSERKMIACAMLSFYWALPDEATENCRGGVLCNVYTLPEFRRKGIMTTLLNKLNLWAKAEGISEIILNAEEAALPLYEKLGFARLSSAMAIQL